MLNWDEWDEALEGGTELQNEVVDSWRWGSVHERIFSKDGKIWGVTYYMQPEEGMDNGMNPEVPEVYELIAREKTIIDYVRVEDA